jgi:hypothetical protein
MTVAFCSTFNYFMVGGQVAHVYDNVLVIHDYM